MKLINFIYSNSGVHCTSNFIIYIDCCQIASRFFTFSLYNFDAFGRSINQTQINLRNWQNCLAWQVEKIILTWSQVTLCLWSTGCVKRASFFGPKISLCRTKRKCCVWFKSTTRDVSLSLFLSCGQPQIGCYQKVASLVQSTKLSSI